MSAPGTIASPKTAVATSGGETRHPLDYVFRPRSIAVVGASKKRGTIGAEVFANLVKRGFNGPLYPVNKTATSIQSVRCYPTVRDIPDPVDMVVISVPSKFVPEVIDDCAAKDVKALVILTAGYGEIDAAGKKLQDELLAKAHGYGMRMVGPNCMGVENADPEFSMDATFARTFPEYGTVSVSSQSGSIGQQILELARDSGVGVHQFISVGNKADVSDNQLLEYWGADPKTSAILLYLENIDQPRRFMELARTTTKTTPIIAVKAGRTESGARAAASHTGALAGADIAVDALFAQTGAIRVDTLEEMMEIASLLSTQPVPRGRNVAIVTNAGGAGILATDACESRGLSLAKLSDDTKSSLRAFLPPEASVNNPVDMLAQGGGEAYEKAVRLLLADANVDSCIVCFVPPILTPPDDVAKAILSAATGSTKPVLTTFMSRKGISESATEMLRHGRFPTYAYPEPAALALARAARYGEWVAKPEGQVTDFTDIAMERATRAIGATPSGAADRWLEPDEVSELLGAFGIRTPKTVFADSPDAAVDAAQEIGYPVVLKLVAAGVLHKTEAGGVRLNLKDAHDVKKAWREMREQLAAVQPGAEMLGATVQPMVRRGVETFVGVTRDPAYGPLIGFGLGGITVELWKDVAFRIAPLTDADAAEMIEQIRGVKLLDGFRGAPATDRDAIRDVLLRVSRLVSDFPAIAEIDLNPLIALASGDGAYAVDARIRVSGA
ncbi:MAG: acetate--CoA ligase family protein [Thermoanaerobaculia bacterium]